MAFKLKSLRELGALTSTEVYESLLRHHLFPKIKEHYDEIPEVFTSNDLLPCIGDKLVDFYSKKPSMRKMGFDQILYRVTRFNYSSRIFHIPHPLPYVLLCKEITENWKYFQCICTNPSSGSFPKMHTDNRLITIGDPYNFPSSSRLFIDSNDSPLATTDVKLQMSCGYKYIARADISNFFSSIYTHSIPWALIGIENAKSNTRKTEWFNKIDFFQRLIKRQETYGIPIGPATSNIISERILYEIDKELQSKKYNYIRYIDDYECYCETHGCAKSFISTLQECIEKYLLTLNYSKTKIHSLPQAFTESWVIDLETHANWKDNLTAREIRTFINYAISIFNNNPENNVLKYCFRMLSGYLCDESLETFFLAGMNIAHYQPTVIPILYRVSKERKFKIKEQTIMNLLEEQIINKRSDSMSWTILWIHLLNYTLSKEYVDRIISTEDCVSISLLTLKDEYKKRVIEFLENINSKDFYLLDKYWLLIYQLVKSGDLKKKQLAEYISATGLSILKDHDIEFLKIAQGD